MENILVSSVVKSDEINLHFKVHSSPWKKKIIKQFHLKIHLVALSGAFNHIRAATKDYFQYRLLRLFSRLIVSFMKKQFPILSGLTNTFEELEPAQFGHLNDWND